MYEAFFNLERAPFSRDIPVGELYETNALKEMHTRLCYVAQARSFGVFTGDAGTGKTTAIRKFSQTLDPNRYRLLYVSDSALTPRNFYWEVLHQLGCEPAFYRGDAKRQFQKALSQVVENEHKSPIVIVDESHLLSREMLEEIRFLLNHRMDSHSTLALILVGQSELKDALRLQVNEAISQRVDMRYHLTGMDKAETRQYLKRHMEAVKAPQEIFTEMALGVIYEYSGGIARKVNKLAALCLLAASTKNMTLIDDHLVRVVIETEFES